MAELGPDSDQDSAPTPGAIREGPPVKPEHFRSVAELNQYLADLTDCALLLSSASKLDTKMNYYVGDVFFPANFRFGIEESGRLERILHGTRQTTVGYSI